jgi:hypothetical protein
LPSRHRNTSPSKQNFNQRTWKKVVEQDLRIEKISSSSNDDDDDYSPGGNLLLPLACAQYEASTNTDFSIRLNGKKTYKVGARVHLK